MERILCYGDSLTWGWIPGTGERFDEATRWTGRLRRMLVQKVEIVEEGINGRTSAIDDALDPHKNGLTYLIPCLLSHRPLAGVVVLLGTNDLKYRFGASVSEVAKCIGHIIDAISSIDYSPYQSPKHIALVSPPSIANVSGDYQEIFRDASAKSQRLGAALKEVAAQREIDFLDASKVVEASPVDGVHLDERGHEVLANAIFAIVNSWI